MNKELEKKFDEKFQWNEDLLEIKDFISQHFISKEEHEEVVKDMNLEWKEELSRYD